MFDINQLETPLSDAEFTMLQAFFQAELETYLRYQRNSERLTLELPLDIHDSLHDLAKSLGSSVAYPLRGVIAVSMPRLKMAARLIRYCRYPHRFRAEVDLIDSDDIENNMAWLLARLLETAGKSKQRRDKIQPYTLWLTPSRKKNLEHAATNHSTDLNRLIVTLLRLALREGYFDPAHHH